MTYIESKSFPTECINCKIEDCYNCEFAGKRFTLSKRDELLSKRKGLEKAIERYQDKISQIDNELKSLEV